MKKEIVIRDDRDQSRSDCAVRCKSLLRPRFSASTRLVTDRRTNGNLAVELNDAEIQLLASLRGALLAGEWSDAPTLDCWGRRYWIFRSDWSRAYDTLAGKGLIVEQDGAYRLTADGEPVADRYHRERPDMYWYYYQRFYPAAHASAAHSTFCERVYGADLCQEGQTDMEAINRLLAVLEPNPADRLLDLGCGAGGISEYISDRTGALVTGVDYSATAIETARARTEVKHERLQFHEADLNQLDLPDAAFDAAISIDSIYWAADFAHTLSSIQRALRPGGQLAILIVQTLADGSGPEVPDADHTPVAAALRAIELDYVVHDLTSSFAGFWPLVKRAAVDLYDAFAAEGNAFIADNWIREADEEYLPALDAGEMRRYLYHARV